MKTAIVFGAAMLWAVGAHAAPAPTPDSEGPECVQAESWNTVKRGDIVHLTCMYEDGRTMKLRSRIVGSTADHWIGRTDLVSKR